MSEQEIIEAGRAIVAYGAAFITFMVLVAIARYLYIVFDDKE